MSQYSIFFFVLVPLPLYETLRIIYLIPLKSYALSVNLNQIIIIHHVPMLQIELSKTFVFILEREKRWYEIIMFIYYELILHNDCNLVKQIEHIVFYANTVVLSLLNWNLIYEFITLSSKPTIMFSFPSWFSSLFFRYEDVTWQNDTLCIIVGIIVVFIVGVIVVVVVGATTKVEKEKESD